MKKEDLGMSDLKKAERQLDLYLYGKLSPTEREALEKTLDEVHVEREEAIEFSPIDSERMLRNLHRTLDMPDAVNNVTWFRIAAVVIIATAGFMVAWYATTVSHASDKLILNDGTLVWLKEGSVLEYPEQFAMTNREVTLRGEALFEVTKDQARPFIIHCGRFIASVVGTSFNLKSGENKVELTVLTGKVLLSSNMNDSSMLIESNEHIVLSGTSGLVEKRSMALSEVNELLKNDQYNMLFEDTRMEDIIRRVEEKFNVGIQTQDESIRDCMISADFTDQSLPVTMSMISEALGVRYSIKDNVVLIEGAGCK